MSGVNLVVGGNIRLKPRNHIGTRLIFTGFTVYAFHFPDLDMSELFFFLFDLLS